jgi:ElaB/YqjD/DUF883 family membrane-anchored ribosome-binding protein
MKSLLGLLVISLALFAIPGKLALADDVSQTDADKFMAFFDKFIDTIVADKDSCPKMAADINKLIDANSDLLKKANEAQKAGKKLPKASEDHMKESSKKIGDAMNKCAGDKGVQAALERMKPAK